MTKHRSMRLRQLRYLLKIWGVAFQVVPSLCSVFARHVHRIQNSLQPSIDCGSHDYYFRHATLLAIMSLRSSYLHTCRKDKFCHVTTCRKRVSKKAPGQEVHRNLSQPIWSPILSVHSGPCLHRCLPAGPGLTQGVAIALCAAPRCSSLLLIDPMLAPLRREAL